MRKEKENILPEDKTKYGLPKPGMLTGPKPLDAWINEESKDIPGFILDKEEPTADLERGLMGLDDVNLEILQTRSQRPGMAINPVNLDNLITICSKKIEHEGTNRKALFIRASSYLKKGQYFESLEDCDKLIAVDPQYAGAYYIRGCAREKLNDFDAALKDYSKVLSLDPFHVNAVFARGACLNKMGEFQKAIDDYKEALQKDELRKKIQVRKLADRKLKGEQEMPSDLVPESNQGLLRYEDKEFSKAKTQIKISTNQLNALKSVLLTTDVDELKGTDAGHLADILHDKGYAARQTGDFQKAISYYSKALEICPDHHTVNFQPNLVPFQQRICIR